MVQEGTNMNLSSDLDPDAEPKDGWPSDLKFSVNYSNPNQKLGAQYQV